MGGRRDLIQRTTMGLVGHRGRRFGEAAGLRTFTRGCRTWSPAMSAPPETGPCSTSRSPSSRASGSLAARPDCSSSRDLRATPPRSTTITGARSSGRSRARKRRACGLAPSSSGTRSPRSRRRAPSISIATTCHRISNPPTSTSARATKDAAAGAGTPGERPACSRPPTPYWVSSSAMESS